MKWSAGGSCLWAEFAIFASVRTIYLFERLNRLPMLRIAAPLAVGILLAGHYTLPLWFLAGAFVLSGVVALLLRSQLAVVAMLAVTGFAAGQLRAPERTVPLGVRCLYEIRVDGIPSDKGRYTSAEGVVTAWRNPADGSWLAAGDRVLLRADSLTSLVSGERLRCSGIVRPIRGGADSYRRLMARRGFSGTLRLSDRYILERLPAAGEALHLAAARRLAKLGMEGDSGAVVRAMTAGDRSSISAAVRADYARSGMSHLLAVSGLHTGIVFLLINCALWWLPLFRRGHLIRNVLAVGAIWLYVAAAGFPPSAIRAAVMCTLLQGALATSSEYVGLNALGAAATGMLLWNPAWLGDISFQLSFIAVGAILVWGVPLCRRLHTGRRIVDAAADTLAIGFVASLATAPLVSHTFGIIPVVGLLLNPLVIPLAGMVVFGGTLWLVLPVALAAPVIRFVAEGAAWLLNELARVTASLPWGVVEQSFSAVQTTAIYLVFLLGTAAAWCMKPKKSVYLSK